MKRPPSRSVLAAAALLAGTCALAWWHASGRKTCLRTEPVPREMAAPALPVRDSVKKVTADPEGTGYLALTYLLRRIPENLNETEISCLLEFIRRPQPGSYTTLGWASVVNDIQEKLTVQNTPSERVARELTAMWRDPSVSDVLRDYSLQHMGGYCMFLLHTRTGMPTFFDGMLGEIKAAAAMTSRPVAGTALNMLDGIFRAADYRHVPLPGLADADLAALAMAAASDPKASPHARLPALQVAARHHAPGALGLARDILSDNSARAPVMLAMSACSVIGMLGGDEDLALLRQLSQNGGPHLRPAAESAIASVTKRTRPAAD